MTDLLEQWHDLHKIVFVLFVQLSLFSFLYRFEVSKDEYLVAIEDQQTRTHQEMRQLTYLLTTISHTRRPTSKYRKKDKPTSFNKLDDRLASTAHEVLNFSICYRISTSQLYNIPVASRGPSADDFGTNRKLIYDFLSR